jgi:hypothetical protein
LRVWWRADRPASSETSSGPGTGCAASTVNRYENRKRKTILWD